MSFKHGTYLGGIRTIEDLRKRCRIDSITKCWCWTLALCDGAPKVHFVAPDTGKRVSMRGRRAALYLFNGKDLPAGHKAFPIDECGEKTCVSPWHTTNGSDADFGAYQIRTGQARTINKVLAGRRVSYEHRAKVTRAQVQDIRASQEPTKVLAKRYGLSESRIRTIQRGQAWSETVPQSSIFSFSGTVSIHDPAPAVAKAAMNRRSYAGGANPNAKLTAEEKTAICARYVAIKAASRVCESRDAMKPATLARDTLAKVGKDFGIAPATVYRIATARKEAQAA